MKKEFSIIQLKKEYEHPKRLTVSNRTITARPGEPIEVPRSETDLWLKTGRFDFVKFVSRDETDSSDAPAPPSDLPTDLPARDLLVRAGITSDQLAAMDKTALLEIKGIGRNLADQILVFLNPETEGGNQ